MTTFLLFANTKESYIIRDIRDTIVFLAQQDGQNQINNVGDHALNEYARKAVLREVKSEPSILAYKVIRIDQTGLRDVSNKSWEDDEEVRTIVMYPEAGK